MNVDLVLGQGRVAGQAILKDVGKAMLARLYRLAADGQAGRAAAPTRAGPGAEAPASLPGPAAVAAMPPGLLGALAIAGLAIGAIGFELGRRRRST